MTPKPYKAKSLSGAQTYVRALIKSRKEHADLLKQFDYERKLLARLAATGPAFSNPLDIYEAQRVRDEILAGMGMNPDGTFRKAEGPAK